MGVEGEGTSAPVTGQPGLTEPLVPLSEMDQILELVETKRSPVVQFGKTNPLMAPSVRERDQLTAPLEASSATSWLVLVPT